MVDLQGRPLHIVLTPGQRHEMTVAKQLLQYALGDAVLADTSYDCTALVQQIEAKKMQAIICQHPKRKNDRRELDRQKYRQRYVVEVYFHKLKKYRALATRYEKTGRNYLALIHLVSGLLWID